MTQSMAPTQQYGSNMLFCDILFSQNNKAKTFFCHNNGYNIYQQGLISEANYPDLP